MGKGTFYGLSMKTPVIYAEIQVLLMQWESIVQQTSHISLLPSDEVDLCAPGP